MITITPYDNGIHSLAEGLRSLTNFLVSTEDALLMKDVVISTHHGLETLFKDILFQKNPIFLLRENEQVKKVIDYYQEYFDGKNDFLFDDAQTITATEALKRIKSLRIYTGVNFKDFELLSDSFAKLNDVRNKLQHFALKANADEIVRVLANLLPPAFLLIKGCYTPDPTNAQHLRSLELPHRPLKTMEGLFGQGRNVEKDLNEIYDKAVETIENISSTYYVMLLKARKEFTKRSLPAVAQQLALRSMGNNGPTEPIYRMELVGWMNDRYEPMRRISFIPDEESRPTSSITQSSVTVTHPKVLDPGVGHQFDVTTSFSVEIDFMIEVANPTRFFALSSLEDYIPYLKSPKIRAKLNVNCEAICSYTSSQFSTQRISTLGGTFSTEMEAMLYGDKGDAPSVVATHSCPLTLENCSLSVHAFVESDARFRDNIQVVVSFENTSDLLFA